MNDLKTKAEKLLSSWCNALKSHQVVGIDDKEIDGAILCPACHLMHGRAFESILPFFWMKRHTGESEWEERAERIFFWADRTLSNPDGSWRNDKGSDWLGTTVFNAIAIADTLIHFSDEMKSDFRSALVERLEKAESFLKGRTSLKNNNINYPITNALALELGARILGDGSLSTAARDFLSVLDDALMPSGLIIGEGIPRSKVSEKGCRSFDVGYNIEESIPALMRYADLTGDIELKKKAQRILERHMMFFLDDGGWDNSMGTRNFKWTYWGSRTSDGCLPALLSCAEENAYYWSAAEKCLDMYERCTSNGLLHGGPGYIEMEENACIHHTFEHAKMLSSCLLEGLFDITPAEKSIEVGRFQPGLHERIDETATHMNTGLDYTSTVTFYDWGYKGLNSGHVSGGTMSLLYWKGNGPLLVAGMGEYTRREVYNMQVPRPCYRHECLDMRIEKEVEGRILSSMYDTEAKEEVEGNTITATGHLRDKEGSTDGADTYSFRYTFDMDKVEIETSASSGYMVLPIITEKDDNISVENNTIAITRNGKKVEIGFSAPFTLPYGRERIFNLIPGFPALKVELAAGSSITFRFK